MRTTYIACLLLASAVAATADLSKALAEKDLEKRSGLAMENAAAALKLARASYLQGDDAKTAAGIAEIKESVELASTSLKQTGKNPRRSPKWFKRAEIGTRDLIRRVEAWQQEMAFEDRTKLDALKARITEIHGELLTGLMEGRKK